MSNLKNTPWKVGYDLLQNFHIEDSSGYWFALNIEDKETAHAIAALPETLAELERVKKERDELIQVIIDYSSPWLRDQMRRILRETKD